MARLARDIASTMRFSRFALWLVAAVLPLLSGCGSARTAITEVPLPVATALPSPVATATLPPVPSPTAAPTRVTSTATATSVPTATPTATPAPVDLDGVDIGLQPFISDVEQPIFATHAGDGSQRVFVVERGGRIVAFSGDGSTPVTFLDISGRINTGGSEQGLLGLAFDPQFATNGYFYVHYTRADDAVVIARFGSKADRSTGDSNSETVLLTAAQPAGNHNGGMLAFGPDGLLYIGLGDGGGAGDQYENAQDLGTILGTVLRIDVRGEQAVAPRRNPFADTSGARPEIWAYGLRNPWRFSFDRYTGDLWIADVGQGSWEEINYQPAGEGGGQNYGWPLWEGLHCYDADSCDGTGMTAPVAEYAHELGCAVTGGYVYRGRAQPALQGIYFYGDYCTGRIWGTVAVADAWRSAELLDSDAQISAFGETESGELLVVDYGGAVNLLVQNAVGE